MLTSESFSPSNDRVIVPKSALIIVSEPLHSIASKNERSMLLIFAILERSSFVKSMFSSSFIISLF